MCPAASVFSQHSPREALDHIYDSVTQLNLALVDSVVCGPILTITITHSTHQDKIKHIIVDICNTAACSRGSVHLSGVLVLNKVDMTYRCDDPPTFRDASHLKHIKQFLDNV